MSRWQELSLCEPRFLLMDEPLSNLDAALSRRLRGEILRLHAELGFTLVYVTHGQRGSAGNRLAHDRTG